MRVSGAKRDDLQAAMALLRKEIELPLIVRQLPRLMRCALSRCPERSRSAVGADAAAALRGLPRPAQAHQRSLAGPAWAARRCWCVDGQPLHAGRRRRAPPGRARCCALDGRRRGAGRARAASSLRRCASGRRAGQRRRRAAGARPRDGARSCSASARAAISWPQRRDQRPRACASWSTPAPRGRARPRRGRAHRPRLPARPARRDADRQRQRSRRHRVTLTRGDASATSTLANVEAVVMPAANAACAARQQLPVALPDAARQRRDAARTALKRRRGRPRCRRTDSAQANARAKTRSGCYGDRAWT